MTWWQWFAVGIAIGLLASVHAGAAVFLTLAVVSARLTSK